MTQRKLNILGHTLLIVADNNMLTSCRWLPDNDENDENDENADNDENVDNDDNDDNADNAIIEITEFIEGKRKNFTIPIEPKGTEFQMKVWDELRRIPYGETITYAELARRIGRPKAYRAVANACGANPLPILIPCHRVISSSGRPGGYTGPSGIKQTLLHLEKQNCL